MKKILFGVIFLIVFAVFLGILSFNDVKKIQKNKIEEAQENIGTYDEKSIILTGTNEKEVFELAEELNATARFDSSFNFATLTLNDQTVIDVLKDDTYLSKIKKMELDYKVSLTEDVNPYQEYISYPNYEVSDPYFYDQTVLSYLNLKDVWSQTLGSVGNDKTVIAVIDTGIDTDNKEFYDSNGQSIISQYSYNATEDKVVKDFGLSVIEDQKNGKYHGTQVAGVIASQMNGIGTVGVAPNVELLVIKCKADFDGLLSTSDCIFGLYYAIERDVDVVSMSIGGPNKSTWEEAIKLATDSDIVCVASAGNDDSSTPTYPAAIDDCIAVGALMPNSFEKAGYSNYGDWVDIYAPEFGLTTYNDDQINYFNGTSSTAPIVAAAIALYKSINGSYSTVSEISEVLFASALDLGDLGKDFIYGYGALNIYDFVLGEKGTLTLDYLTDEIEPSTHVFIKGIPLQNIPFPDDRLYSVFDGWYNDIHLQDEINYYQDIWTEDLTLYASWVNEDDTIAYSYEELDDGTLKITSYNGKRRFISVPEKIGGKTVTVIGDRSFNNNGRIRSLELPDTIKVIGDNAFSFCYNLLQITIPSGVEIIGESAFESCNRLSAINIPSDSKLTYIGDAAFASTSIKEIYLPENLSDINGSAFYSCSLMKKINLSNENSFYTIENNALYNSDKSILVYYPSSLTGEFSVNTNTIKIGKYAFSNSSISGAVLPRNLEKIEHYAFYNSDVKTMTIPQNVSDIDANAFAFCYNLQSFIIEDDSKLVSIPTYMMCANFMLSQFSFGANSRVEVIDSSAFYGCSSLDSIQFPEGLKTIKSYAFFSSGLEEVNLANTQVEYIDSNAFRLSPELALVSLPNTVELIGEFAFADTKLKTINLPSNLVTLGHGAFAYNELLTSITSLSDKFYVIDNVIYYYDGDDNKVLYTRATGLSDDFTVSSDVYKIDNYAFAGSKINNITFNEGLVEIGAFAFNLNRNLSDVSFPNSLEFIGEEAFSQCNGITKIVITSNVISIGRFAFAYDYNLDNISFEEGKLSRLGYGSLGYTGIKEITIPASVSTMGQGVFIGSNNLTKVIFADNSKLESISAYIFQKIDNLQTIEFGSNSKIDSIQARAFSGLTSLRSINLEELTNLTNIDNYSFYGCSNLTNLTLPENVENIGRYAFFGCSSLGSISIPAKVEHIGGYAFNSNRPMDVYFESSTLPLNLDEYWDYGIAGYYVGVEQVLRNNLYSYAILSDNTVSIIQYYGSSEVLTIDTIDGYTVSSIGGYAFNDNQTLREVYLPNTIKYIGNRAFANTTNLQTIHLNQGIEAIYDEAFINSNISSIELPSTIVVLGKRAFANTSNLKEVDLPDAVKEIPDELFYNSGLEKINISIDSNLDRIGKKAFQFSKIDTISLPNSLTFIDNYAFANNDRLNNIIFGEGALRINHHAFSATGINEINIPKEVYYIGESVFSSCLNLESINVDEDNLYYASIEGVLYNKDYTKLICCPSGKEGTYEINEDVLFIGFGAFENSELSEIIISPNSNLTTIGYAAFMRAENITTITLPDSILSIDYYAFAYCTNLEEVIISPNSQISGIYEGAFYNCQNLKSIYIPEKVQEIGEYAFYGCSRLVDIVVSSDNNIKGISDYAFAYSGILDISFTEGILEIGEYAFVGTQIDEIILPDSLISVGSYAFKDCSNLKVLKMGENVLYIGEGIVEGCDNLKELTLTNLNNETVGYYFGDNAYNTTKVSSNLKSITIHYGNIPNYAFAGCHSVVEINLPVDCQRIEANSFIATNKLQHLYIPESVEYIADGCLNGLGYTLILIASNNNYGLDSFINYVTNVLSLDANDEYEYVTFKDGTVAILKYLGNDTNLEITTIDNHEVTGILYQAFYECKNIETISLPDTLTKIGAEAFKYCESLKEIVIPSSVKVVDNLAFSNCRNLSKIVFEEGVEEINGGIFECRKLEEIYIPQSMKKINGIANTPSVSFYYAGSIDEWFQIEMNNMITSSHLYINNELVREVNLTQSIEVLGANIAGNYDIKKIIIPEGVKTISESAFGWCMNLEEIILPTTLENIGTFAFERCTNLKYIIIPETVKVIGNYAFDSDSLVTIYLESSSVSEGFAESWNNDCVFYTNFADFGANEQYEYVIFNDNTVIISKYLGNEKQIIIDNVDGYIVKAIGSSAFAQTEITTLILNEAVESIGASAFKECRYLTTIDLANVKNIQNQAFNNCINLAEIKMSSVIEYIGSSAFANTKLTEIVLPSSLQYLGDYVFSNCALLEEVTILGEIDHIGHSAFQSCSSLEKVDLPDSITYFNNYAFENCISLKYLIVPEKLKTFNYGVFDGCNIVLLFKGNAIISVEGNSYIETKITSYMNVKEHIIDNKFEYVLTNDEEVILMKYFGNDDEIDLTDFNGYDVISIADGAFKNSNISKVLLPETLNFIGDYVFENCNNLINITIPDNVSKLGNFAFNDCDRLEKVIIGENIISINNNTFANCQNLIYVRLPINLESIYESAFYGCSNLYINHFGYELNYIGNNAFNGCENLTEITFNSYIGYIGSSAFTDVLKITFNENSTTENWAADWNLSSDTVVYLNGGNINTEFYTDGLIFGFDEHQNFGVKGYVGQVEEVIIPNTYNGLKVTHIFADAFNGNQIIKRVILPDTIKEIGNNAFYETNLDYLEFSNSVKKVGQFAFYANIGIFNYLGDLNDWVNIDAVNGMSLPIYYSNTDYFYGQRVTTLTFPYIGKDYIEYQFYGLTDVDTLIVSDGVEVINSWIFGGGRGVKSIYLPQSIKKCSYMFLEQSEVVYFESDKLPINTDEFDTEFYNTEFIYNVKEINVVNNIIYVVDNSDIINFVSLYENSNSLVIPEQINGKNYHYKIDLNNFNNIDIIYLPFNGVESIRPSKISHIVLGSGYNLEDTFDLFGCDNVYISYTKENCFYPEGWENYIENIYYQNQWALNNFYLYNGSIKSTISLSSEVLKTPSENELIVNDHFKEYNFKGWDINGDFSVDIIPTTVIGINNFYSIYETSCKHVNLKWETINELSCLNDGLYHQKCIDCDFVLVEKIISAIKHNYEWSTIIPATCSQTGISRCVCLYCGDVAEEKEIPTLEHKAGEWIIDNEATCASNGNRHNECEYCRQVLNQGVIDILEHILGNWIIDKEATCTSEGSRHNGCINCDYEIYETIPQIEHQWDGGVITVYPTTESRGEMTYSCINCGKTITESIDKLTPTQKDDTPKGCGGSITGSLIGVISLIGLCAFVKKKRKYY